ncbi:methyltransferase domain protein [Mycobacterium ulcerans str. Harvey]|uniref:Methyltransferase domain protein n=1 Tax=Mycobacterium ulcerans str. Harvey TaxID=1299332 RepID=A0ABN0RAG0_MYCUL|nr:methyltransferase domain protein [Mycobacterium ulcerans str. Harvey]
MGTVSARWPTPPATYRRIFVRVVRARHRLRPGTITVDLAARVAPGTVTAVEPTDAALNLGRAEAQRCDVSNVAFVTSDVHALDFPDDVFDVVHAHQVLQHVADPVQALREMKRVGAPGRVGRRA